jgi:serine/threonine protein kinase
MVLEYCNGGDLWVYQKGLKDGVFKLEEATAALKDVILGLEEVHRQGFIHRDIKNTNVLVHTDNNSTVSSILMQKFKLADFGFTKKNQDIRGSVLGTEYYMSPEIYREDQEQKE